MRSPKEMVNPFIRSLGWVAIWAITIHSCTHVIRPPEAPAPADTVILKRISNSILVGTEALKALAQVSGLGHPVRGAEVLFEVSGLGDVPPSSALTGDAGFAAAFLDLKKAGSGILRATVVGSEPPLVDEIPIDAVNKRAIRLEQRPSFVTVKAGSSRSASLAVHVLRVVSPPSRVKFEIEPDSGGIVISDFPTELDVDVPKTISLAPVITGVTPGTYSVTTTATIVETGDSYTSGISVRVVDPEAPDLLVLSRPAADPAGIPPSKTQTTVVFRALVSGTRTPPKDLCLIEVDAAGEVLEPKDDPKDECVAVLRDDGKGRDSQARDLFYSGPLKIGDPKLGNPVETEKFYRVRVNDYFGKTVTSDIESFNVTNYPIERPLSKGPTAEDPRSIRRLYTNEVTFTVRRGTSADRVKEIVSAVGGEVVGFWPPLRDYLVEIKGDGTAKGVYEAIATILKFDDVEAASPNHVVVNPGVTPTDPEFASQWYLPHVGADEAWQVGAKGGLTVMVATIDTGIDCSDTPGAHPDLRGRCSGGDQTDLTGHGSLAGGIIAANTDNSQYIAGVAWYTSLIPLRANGSDQVRTAIDNARGTEAKIIHVNVNVVHVPELKTAVEGVITDGFLIVAAAGNLNQTDEGCILGPENGMAGNYPAAYNGDPNLTDAQKRSILAVGATDQGDELATDFIDYYGTTRCSNFAPWIDLYAPGKNMISTVPLVYDVQAPSDGLMTVSGTSFATPLVAGAAAVLWALDPIWTPEKVHETLINSATPLPAVASQSFPELQGKRRLNLAAAVNRPPNLLAIPDQTVDEGDTLTITLTASDLDGDSLTFQQPSDLPAFATLTDNGDGTATLNIAPGFTDAGTYGPIMFEITDDGDPQRSDSKTMTITVNDMNPDLPPPAPPTNLDLIP